MIFVVLKKCLDHDNALVKNVGLIALNHHMFCVGDNYRHILSKYDKVLNNTTCVYDDFYSMCDEHMDIFSVLKDRIDVRDDFKTCAYFTTDDVEDVINDIYLNWNVKGTFWRVLNCTIVFLLQCVNKDIILLKLIEVIHVNIFQYSYVYNMIYWSYYTLNLGKSLKY